MRTINWNKIPAQKIIENGDNLWTKFGKDYQGEMNGSQLIDYGEMEALFCQPVPIQGSPMLGRKFGDNNKDSANVDSDKRKRESNEVILLDGKRSLNINIFLKQFRTSNENIIALIKEGDHDAIGAEKLRGLLKILPESDEVEMLKSHDGPRSRLGNAEMFLLQLMDVSSYKLRIEGMLLKEEYTANANYLNPAITQIAQAANDLKTNKALQDVLFMVTVSGNFINAGGYAGDAAGFRLTSLQKLTDIRANKPGMNFIHYVVQMAEKKDKKLLEFPDDLKYLDDVSKISIDQLKTDIICAMEQRISRLLAQVQHAELDIQQQMMAFLEHANEDCKELKNRLENLESVRVDLCHFYCEDEATFKLEECYKLFANFCQKFKSAIEENAKRQSAELKAEERRKQREENARKRQSIYGDQIANAAPSEAEGSDAPGFFRRQEDEPSVTSSPRIGRRYLGSVDGSSSLQLDSPDVTPTGTLRGRRRARVTSDETDDDLMGFLRSNAMENEARERRSWNGFEGHGSLDRSIGRRQRKKRPDLLNVEFLDRERPASPALLATPVSPCSDFTETEPPSSTKLQKQKVEDWLEQAGQDNRLAPPTERKDFKKYTPVFGERWNSPVMKNADVEKALEVIESAQVKDKSAWRKSNLNVRNTVEPVTYSSDKTSPRRASVGASPSSAGGDTLRLYFTKTPIDDLTETDSSVAGSKMKRSASEDHSSGSLSPSRHSPRRNSSWDQDTDGLHPILEHDKEQSSLYTQTPTGKTIIRINGSPLPSNSETPPFPRRSTSESSTRRITDKNEMSADASVRPSAQTEQDADLGDGQFDRFSSIRRTRRFRQKSSDSPESVKSPSPRDDIDEALRDIKKTSEELKLDMTPTRDDETNKVTRDYEKVTSRTSPRRTPSLRTRPTSLSLDGHTGEKTFKSTYSYTPTSPEKEFPSIIKSPPVEKSNEINKLGVENLTHCGNRTASPISSYRSKGEQSKPFVNGCRLVQEKTSDKENDEINNVNLLSPLVDNRTSKQNGLSRVSSALPLSKTKLDQSSSRSSLRSSKSSLSSAPTVIPAVNHLGRPRSPASSYKPSHIIPWNGKMASETLKPLTNGNRARTPTSSNNGILRTSPRPSATNGSTCNGDANKSPGKRIPLSRQSSVNSGIPKRMSFSEKSTISKTNAPTVTNSSSFRTPSSRSQVKRTPSSASASSSSSNNQKDDQRGLTANNNINNNSHITAPKSTTNNLQSSQALRKEPSSSKRSLFPVRKISTSSATVCPVSGNREVNAPSAPINGNSNNKTNKTINGNASGGGRFNFMKSTTSSQAKKSADPTGSPPRKQSLTNAKLFSR
ncbi:FH2 [Chamberlinius hualienensis]